MGTVPHGHSGARTDADNAPTWARSALGQIIGQNSPNAQSLSPKPGEVTEDGEEAGVPALAGKNYGRSENQFLGNRLKPGPNALDAKAGIPTGSSPGRGQGQCLAAAANTSSCAGCFGGTLELPAEALPCHVQAPLDGANRGLEMETHLAKGLAADVEGLQRCPVECL
jgi:hypothetical protein